MGTASMHATCFPAEPRMLKADRWFCGVFTQQGKPYG